MAVKLGDVVPNFSAASTHGKIDFHTWCEVRRTRDKIKVILQENLITYFSLYSILTEIHIKCYDICFWKGFTGHITDYSGREYTPVPLWPESCPCFLSLSRFHAMIHIIVMLWVFSPLWPQGSWSILFSHPADYTPVCTTELGRAQSFAGEFAKRWGKMMMIRMTLMNHDDQYY